MSMVAISPKTVRAMRSEKGYRTQEEAVAKTVEVDAKGEGLSARQWSRIEASKKPLMQVRRGTAELIAKTLGVTRVEDLGKPVKVTAERSDAMRNLGYRRRAFWLDGEVRRNYRCVTLKYDVSDQDLINAAPWMFTLLAEMSLTRRAQRINEFEDSFEESMKLLPHHLGHGNAARNDFEWAVDDEKASLDARDVFGNVVLMTKNATYNPFDPDKTNPFHAFVKALAATVDQEAIDPKFIDLPSGRGMPSWPVFQKWLDELTGDDVWALFAVENVKGVLRNLPNDLNGKEKTPERIEWLINQIPPEMRAREEERLAQAAAEWDELGLTI